MSNIFEYRPELQYILRDINTIDNIKDERIQSMESYITNGAANVLIRIDEVKTLIQEVRTNIDKKLKDVTVPFDTTLLDDVVTERLDGLRDSSQLINDGIITYELYKEVKDEPIFAGIEDAWDEYHCGMNGVIEAEIMPYVDISDDILSNIIQFVDNALLYDEDIQARSNTSKLKESELLQIEQYLRLQDELEEATRNADSAKYVSTKKQFDMVDNRLKYRKNINLMLMDILGRMASTLRDMYDGTLTEFQNAQYKVLEEQLTTLKKNLGISDLSIRAIVYSAFLGQYGGVLNLKRNYKNVVNKNSRNKTFRTAVTEARLYRDVAVPSTIELLYADKELPMREAGNIVLNGVERITKLHQRSLLSTKNVLESDTRVVSNLINKVYEKYRTRTMYKLMGK